MTLRDEYDKLEEEYNQKFSEMSVTQEGIRYLKIRTLIDVETLKASKKLRKFLQIQKPKEVKRTAIEKKRKELFFNRSFSDQEIDRLLKEVYLELRSFRQIDFKRISSSVSRIAKEGDEYWKAWNSVYRDDIRQHIQHRFVRAMDIQSYEELLKKINKDLNPIIKGYVIISWYNQWSSTIIEDFILVHPRVVPTARRIDKVDFFFLNIPFDLKITFIPQEFITQCRREKIILKDRDVIEYIRDNPEHLMKWFYENQGESRFSDSHRLFIVLADTSNLENSWKLKADFNLIKERIDDFLNKCKMRDDINILQWEFKGEKIKGQYKTYSHLILIER